MQDKIIIKGARVHNLKNIDVTIPRDKLVVLTGLSGSGKSSLAFDTLFAEGQRRYMESLSSYARQFLGQMDKPDVDYIEGLSPAISIDQKTTSHNPRSTVGTVTEIYDYLRLLYARIGVPHCPKCGKEIVRQTVDQIADKIMALPEGSKIMVVSPVVRGRKGEFAKLLESFRKSGYMRVEVDGVRYDDGAAEVDLDKNIKHTISVVVDRLVIKQGIVRRLTDSLEAALKLSEGLVECVNGEEVTLYSTKYACPDCDIAMEELTPRLFSFNSPFGACPKCFGLGFSMVPDLNKFVKWDKSLAEGAVDIKGWSFDTCKVNAAMMRALAKKYNFSLTTPFKDLPEKIQKIVLYGDNKPLDADMRGVFNNGFYSKVYEGVCNIMSRRYTETTSDLTKMELERFMSPVPCDVCHGKRLKKEALGVTVGGLNIAELCDLSIDEELKFFNELKLNERDAVIAAQVIKEIKGRLGFMVNVGLDYLTLSRSSYTL